jgi:hypothetical protein
LKPETDVKYDTIDKEREEENIVFPGLEKSKTKMK